MLAFPPTIKYDTFIFNPDIPKDHYIQISFKEVLICQAPEHIVFYDNLKCIRRVFLKVTYFNVHTIKMVYSSILNLIFAMMFHNKLILTDLGG